MGLPDVLSAVRQLILDGIDLPACAGDRQKLYAIRFQGLSADELEDLAQMDPARLGLYTRSIFAAEGRMLTSYFPLTLHLLKRGWPHGIYSARELAHRIHGVAPWRGIHSPSLGTCLGEFIQHGRAWTIEPMPYIEDVYRYEQASLEIRKAPNEDPRPHGVERLRDAASVSVEEMLSWKA